MKRKKMLCCFLLTIIATMGFTDGNPFSPSRQEVTIGDCAGPNGSCISSQLSSTSNSGN